SVVRDDGSQEVDGTRSRLHVVLVPHALADDLPQPAQGAQLGLRQRGLIEEPRDVGALDGGLRRRKPLHAIGHVDGAPSLDQPPKSVVRGDLAVQQRLPRDRACVLPSGEDPPLDAVAVVGDAGPQRHRILHELQRYGAKEVGRYLHSFHGDRPRLPQSTEARNRETSMEMFSR
ncbi:hypothetical protein MUK42_13444, partial [Musa troglodytarum]